MKLSQREMFVLGLLTILVVGLIAIGLGIVYINYEQPLVLNDIVTATEIIPLLPTYTASYSQIPTSIITFTPTAAQSPDLLFTRFVVDTPTQRIFPSLTPFTIAPINTPIPISPQQNPPQQSTPQQNPNQPVAIDCSPKLNYAKSVHQYNLANIDSRYRPLITYYENMLQQAIRERDALAVVQYQRELDSVNKQYNAAIKAENKRYEGEIAYIKSTCK